MHTSRSEAIFRTAGVVNGFRAVILGISLALSSTLICRFTVSNHKTYSIDKGQYPHI